jgi:hypothetical protein
MLSSLLYLSLTLLTAELFFFFATIPGYIDRFSSLLCSGGRNEEKGWRAVGGAMKG